MKEEIRKFKERHKKCQEIILDTNRRMIVLDSNRASKDESLRFVNFMFEKNYGEGYLLNFMDCLKMQPTIIEQKYKKTIEQINKHLVKIIEEYKQLTDELDEAIFGKAGV